ncbi:MAG: hypothetical protein KDN19_07915 [Verrucomicrobiae bacterium]|nr:hypothetical protein [Verrucomicrobiae bacterium]
MPVLESFEIEIPFKGARDYLQSADVYHAVLAHLDGQVGIDSCHDVRLIFRNFARTRIAVITEDELGDREANASFLCEVGGEKLKRVLVETGKDVTAREPYPEEEIVERCVVDAEAKTVTLEHDDSLDRFKLMEILVAMNKAMHLEVFKEHPGKWLFTETRNPEPLFRQPWRRLSIRIKNQLGVKLTRSVIEVGGVDAGYLCFSLQPPASSS